MLSFTMALSRLFSVIEASDASTGFDDYMIAIGWGSYLIWTRIHSITKYYVSTQLADVNLNARIRLTIDN